MQRFRFPIAVALTSLALVLGLVVVGGLAAGSVLAFGPPWRGGWGGHHSLGSGFALPPELAGLSEVPADQRFTHFQGAQVRLTDRDGRPITVEATPGRATAASATGLTIAANDGSSRSFTLNDRTVLRGKQTPAPDDQVVVVTLNGGADAHAVLVLTGEAAGPRGRHLDWGVR